MDLLTVIHSVILSCLFHIFGFEAHLAVGFIFLVIILKVFFPDSLLTAWWFSKFSQASCGLPLRTKLRVLTL